MAFPHRPDAPELPDFSMLKRLARDQLIYLLEQLPGKKDLFIEADLMSPLDRIANVSILKQHEVDKLYKVENKPALSSNEQLCFLVRPRIKNMRYVASEYGVAPRITKTWERVAEMKGRGHKDLLMRKDGSNGPHHSERMSASLHPV